MLFSMMAELRSAQTSTNFGPVSDASKVLKVVVNDILSHVGSVTPAMEADLIDKKLPSYIRNASPFVFLKDIATSIGL